MNRISQNIKKPCYLCERSLNTWIETSVHLDGSEKPCILCFGCAKEIIIDVDRNSTEHETRELLQDVKQYPALLECKGDSFLKKYLKILWVVLAMLIYLPVMILGALVTKD